MGVNEIIIGSTAMKRWYPEFPREPSDLDIVVKSKEGLKGSKEVEYLLNPVLFKHEKSKEGYISPDLLLTLKVSHLFWDINWEKHLFDTQWLLEKGHKVNREAFEEFLQYWKETKPKIKRSNLEMSKEEFFDNAVNKDTLEHDELHKLINPVPMYTRLLKEGAEVELDISKFEKMSHEDKLEVVREETYVMAYERFKGVYYKRAFKRMLKKCIIQHFPKEIAIFALLNYKVLEVPSINFIKTIEDGLRKVK